MAHSRAHGRPSYTVSILIVGNIATGMIALIPMSSAKMSARHWRSWHYRSECCIVESGPQLRHLISENNKELTAGLSQRKI